ncbi:Rad52/Rad22 family DNA repair protein [Streptomyces sp. NPDC047042]|uniref:Rad52/Rad22 family DNA repair protein n=1 Tax=Streptomyces sp. NPDC047042 TaxID=3154807 RepID=UPI00340E6360
MTELTSRLTDQQLKVLYSGLHNDRVGFNQKGFAHVQQWDVRRFLIRVFGFGGYDTELVSIDLIREIEHPASNQGGKPRWTVAYRVHQRLTVKDVAGRPIATFDGVATGDAQNQPSLGDAHDGAVKEADSQSLKRAAVNLGDAFGLSLYNGGKTNPVVLWSAAHPHLTIRGPVVGQNEAAPEDPPVEPEPDAKPSTPDPEPSPPAPAPAPAAPSAPTAVPDPPQQRPGAMPAAVADAERQSALESMWAAARAVAFEAGLAEQFVTAFGHPIDQGTAAEFRQARDLMTGSAAA